MNTYDTPDSLTTPLGIIKPIGHAIPLLESTHPICPLNKKVSILPVPI